MYQFIINVVCMLLPIICSGYPVTYTDCGPADALKSVDIVPCSTNPCDLPKGVNGTVTINFQATMDSDTLVSKVYGIMAGVPIPFPLPNPDGCKDSNIQCPITKGSSYSYIATLPVLKIYPTIRVPVKWELQDGNQNNVVCFVFPLKISG